jgi:uncharacterized protein (DUF2384 family)
MAHDINRKLIDQATQVFVDKDKALHWLTREQRCFQGVTPMDYATGARSMATVLGHLIRIEHGIYPGR